jgi:protein-S-isoprenylcysteine O-methyltransferase Ste14
MRLPPSRRAKLKLNYVTLAVFSIAVIVFAARSPNFQMTPAHIAGIAILIPSFILFVISRVQLGSAFSVEAKASTLVTTGIYSRIRNPIYVFGVLMFVGIIVWASRPIYFLIFLVIVPLQIRRARNEARVLQEKFGDEYIEYKKKTWF